MSGREMSFTTIASSALRSSFARARSTPSGPCSAAKPTMIWPSRRCAAASASTSAVATRSTVEGVASLLRDLGVLGAARAGSRRPRRPSAAGRTSAKRASVASRSSSAVWTSTYLTPGVRVERGVGCDHRHGRAPARRLGGQREAHPAARAVADEAHRVERLARAARRDQHPHAVERAAARRPATISIASRIAAGSARRPTPHSPREASGPVPGSITCTPRSRSRSRGSPASPGARTCGCSSPARPAPGSCRPGRRR